MVRASHSHCEGRWFDSSIVHQSLFMILSSHILIGGAVGTRSKNIYWAFLFGLVSHYLLDAIPHWEYLSSLDEALICVNMFKIAVDFGLGLLAVWMFCRIFSRKISWKVLIAVGASILPDAGQTIIYFLKLNWLKPLFDFHQTVHSPIDLAFWPGLAAMVLVFAASALIMEL